MSLSPFISDDRAIIQRLWDTGHFFAPDAESVHLVGDFNDWDASANEMKPRWDGSGIWEAEVTGVQKGASYILHLSALDVNHGFSLFPVNVNFQVVPGYDYGLRITPNTSGDFRIICNEFCGVGHHMMLGKVLVTDEQGNIPGQTPMTPVTAMEEK